MICLTGDIHHRSLQHNDQKAIENPNDSEVIIACRYLRLIEKYNLKFTFYITGKTFKEEWEDIKPITESSLVETGGHTYSALPRPLFSRLLSKLTGITTCSHSNSHGSYSKQKRDAKKMIDIVKKRTGKHIVSWRSHALLADKNTYKILAELGIKVISDEIDWDNLYPEKIKEGLISHPLNVMVDHEHIYHAHRTKKYVEKQKKNWSTRWNEPTKESYNIDEWGEIVRKQVIEKENKGGVTTILMHPLCMYLPDRFKTAESLFKTFSQYKTIWAQEIPQYLK